MRRLHQLQRHPSLSLTLGASLALLCACSPKQDTTKPEDDRNFDRTVEAPDETAPDRTWTTTLGVQHPLTGTAFDVRTGAPTTIEALLEEVPTRSYVLLGETHDNPDHHALQAEFLAAAAPNKPLVVMEHIDPKHQEALDGLEAYGASKVDVIRTTVHWDDSGWPAFDMFRPIFEVAVDHDLQIHGALFPREKAMEVGQKGVGAADPELVASHGLDQPLPEAANAALLEVLVESHCNTMPAEAMAPMVGIQRVRDAMLVDGLHSQDHAVMIAGSGHVRRDWGSARTLGMDDTLVIAFIQVDDERTDASQYVEASKPFDAIVFTPRVSDEDPCAAMRK